jgi:cell division protein FtsI (penicillin-binding protein 3)
MLFFFAALALRTTYLTLFNEQAVVRADRQILTSMSLEAERGKIYDRNERTLALSIDTPSVYALRSEIEDTRAAARKLAAILKLDAAALEKRLSPKQGGNFVYLKRWISPEQSKRIEALKLRGVGIHTEPKRSYPGKELAAAILGFTNIDGMGVRGIEQQADRWLHGTRRTVGVERDGHGRLFAVEGVDPHTLAGNDLMLTLDARFQASAEDALEQALEKTGAESGIVITLDRRTGEILALAERPTFDPNQFRTLSYPDTRSRAFTDVYEPGSTLKPFLVAMALDEGTLTPDQTFDCEDGAFRVPGRTIHDSHPHQFLSVSEIIQVSSNIGATKIAFELSPKAHYKGLERFGFTSNTGSGFPSESNGILRPWKKWQPVDHANVAFGQGISSTAIQLAAATAAIANEGVWVTPQLIKARRSADGQWVNEKPGKKHRAVSKESADLVLAMMESVVSTDGTARLAGLKDVRVSGKTGTAQKYDVEANRYSNTRYLAWFTGIVPTDNPEFVIVTLLDEPKGWAHGGGDVAAPLFAKVAAEQLRWRGIYTEAKPKPRKIVPKEESAPLPVRLAENTVIPRQEVRKEETFLAPPPVRQANLTLTQVGDSLFLPDLRGLSVAQVKEITAKAELTLEISGSGVAVSQSPEPGTVLAKGNKNVAVTFGRPRREL